MKKYVENGVKGYMIFLKKRTGRQACILAIAADHNGSAVKPSVVVNSSKLMDYSDVSLFRTGEMLLLLKHFQ